MYESNSCLFDLSPLPSSGMVCSSSLPLELGFPLFRHRNSRIAPKTNTRAIPMPIPAFAPADIPPEEVLVLSPSLVDVGSAVDVADCVGVAACAVSEPDSVVGVELAILVASAVTPGFVKEVVSVAMTIGVTVTVEASAVWEELSQSFATQ